MHVPAVGAVAGIGFTVSLFIADLAYDDPALTETAKVGIFAGSLLAGIIGAALMVAAGRRPGRVATTSDRSVPKR
jgi:NhaA family Na+:H+ antiporter